MDFDSRLEELHARPRYAKKQDLSRIEALMQALGHPEQKLSFVHVAGTNGKGSTCAMIAAVLRSAGYRVGLYTSPYLKHFEERIQVNGMCIPRDAFCRIYDRVLQEQTALEAAGGDPANEFEVTTAIGLLWFAEQRCDYVVLEVGLGGRLDATNVIPPQKVCCIAQIGLDHTLQLGSTIPEIAREKAGIIKPGSLVITPGAQHPDAVRVFADVCEQVGARLLVTELPEQVQTLPDMTAFSYQGQHFATPLSGPHQAANAACAIELCRALGQPDAQIQTGLSETVWPARFQRIGTAPLAVLDCAHNPNGMESLLASLDRVYPGKRLVALMAMMQDKDYSTCVRMVASRASAFIATTLAMPRALGAEELAGTAAESCADCRFVQDAKEALTLARSLTGKDALLLICGSVYLAGEILHIVDENPAFDKI